MADRAAYLEKDCERCDLCDSASQVVRPRGSSSPTVLFVGDFPGRPEDRGGRPFLGRSGEVLERLLAEAGIDPAICRWTSAVRCFPGPGAVPKDEEIEACKPILLQEIALTSPKVVIAMGVKAWQSLTGKKSLSGRGVPQELELPASVTGLTLCAPDPKKVPPPVLEGKKVVVATPTYNPSYFLRANSNPVVYANILADLRVARTVYDAGARAAVEKTARGYKAIRTRKRLVAVVDQILARHAEGRLPYGAISVDLETAGEDKGGLDPWRTDSRIISLQISWRKGRGWLLPLLHLNRKTLPKNVFRRADGFSVARAQFARLIEAGVPVINQAIGFDDKWIWAKLGLRFNVAGDSMLAHSCLYGGSRPNDLGYMSGAYLGAPPYKRSFQGALASHNYEEADFRDLTHYGCRDTDYALRLERKFREELREHTLNLPGTQVGSLLDIYERFYLRPLGPLTDMSIAGAYVDHRQLESLEGTYDEIMRTATETLCQTKWFRKWRKATRRPNPRRHKVVSSYGYQEECKRCRRRGPWKPSAPRTKACPGCGAKKGRQFGWRRRTESSKTIEQSDQPRWEYRSLCRKGWTTERSEAAINIGSWHQIQPLLYDVMRLSKVNPKGKEDTSTEAPRLRGLGEDAHAEGKRSIVHALRQILIYKKAEKTRGTYARGLVKKIGDKGEPSPYPSQRYEDRRPWILHASFNLGGAATGRLSCVAPWTPIVTEHGLVPITAVRVGDRVRTHRGRFRRVTRTIYKGVEEMVDLELANGEVLSCTTDHRLLLSDGSWKKVGEIVDERQQEVGRERGESRGRVGVVPVLGAPNHRGHCGEAGYNSAQRAARRSVGAGRSPLQGAQGPSLLGIEGGGFEPHEGEDRGGEPQLEGGVLRRQGLLDAAGWEASGVRSQVGDGRGIGPRRVAGVAGRPSHRRRPDEQPPGQPRALHAGGALRYPLLAGRDGSTAIEAIVARGSVPVYDLTVEEDHSYESCGVFHHNSSDPNLQNIPKKGPIRKAFISRHEWGLIFSGDFSQMELRIMACVARDEHFQAILAGQDSRFAAYGGDIHLYTACQVFKKTPEYVRLHPLLRRRAKSVSFGIIYGRGARAIAAETGMTVEEAEDLIRSYFELFPKTARWIASQHRRVRSKGSVYTPTGRYCPLEDGMLRKRAKERGREMGYDEREAVSRAERQAVNYPIQGGASDVGLDALVYIHEDYRRLALKTCLFAMVHDSLDNDLHTPELFTVHGIMEQRMLNPDPRYFGWLKVPLVVDYDVGVSWGEQMSVKQLDAERGLLVVKGPRGYWEKLEDHLAAYYRMSDVDVKDGAWIRHEPTKVGLSVEDIEPGEDYQEVHVSMRLRPRKSARTAP